ncbi:cytochrome c551 [Halalkalibacter hemicellulosilyticusJCM 9152]|uniref:Cytochrome c551 n=1 Tax=Halalkalibacter hemicellulosilyticusJCM 9152 TaxID=1236971 RepID=W4QF05_9BACI|nr:cytochrome c551 [Halalkalibacter hemicellulosilyticusJCM 9152]
MKGKPLLPFAVTAIVGILLMVALSFWAMDQRAQMDSDEEAEEEIVIDDPIVAGEELYSRSCISCHGGDLSGTSGPALNALEGHLTAEEIVNIIHTGPGTMPAFDNLSDLEADAIAQYLLSESE